MTVRIYITFVKNWYDFFRCVELTQIGTKSSNTRKHVLEPQFSHFAKNLCELLVLNPPSRRRIGNELVCNEFHSISHAIGACNQIS